MIIVVCGPDGVGKSTQIRHLKTFFSHNRDKLLHEMHYTADVAKSMQPEQAKSTSREYYRGMFCILTEMMKHGFNIVCDRAHLGEAVYAQKYRNYSGDYVFDMEKEFSCVSTDPDTYLIVFVADPEDLACREDGNSLGQEVEDKIEEVSRFREAFRKSNFRNKILIDITRKDEYDVWSEVIKFIDGDRG